MYSPVELPIPNGDLFAEPLAFRTNNVRLKVSNDVVFSDHSIDDFNHGIMSFQLCATNILRSIVECSDFFELDYTFSVATAIVCSDQALTVDDSGTNCLDNPLSIILDLQ